MLSANEIAGFLNQLYLKNEITNRLDFWHNHIDSRNKGWFVEF